MEFEIGKTYKMTHRRKGRFVAKVTEITGHDHEWLTVEIVDGVAQAIMAYNMGHPGDSLMVRRQLIDEAEVVDA